MLPRFERVAVIGVGLIGGSLALAARAAGIFGHVRGVGRNLANLEEAQRRGIVDTFSVDARDAVADADLVVLAVPVRSMADAVRQCGSALQRGTLVSDVGSVKRYVVDAVEAALPVGVRFVGAHPIAGTEDSGAAAARADLFLGHRCVITPGSRSDEASVARIRALWEGVGMQVVLATPEEHDLALAWVSHLPHALAFAVSQALDLHHPQAAVLAGPSFASLTRVAASRPDTWVDVFLANRVAIEDALEHFLAALGDLRRTMASGSAEDLHAWLSRAREAHLRRRAATDPRS